MKKRVSFYPGIENLYGQTEDDPIKVFLITRPFVYSALTLAAMDGNDIREGFLNTLDGPESDGFYIKQDGRKFANDVARGRIRVILDQGVNVNDHEIFMVDIVTYPFFHCLLTGYDPFSNHGNGLWKVNHNILAPFVECIRDCGYAYTFIHVNEDPIDDAPTHNLIAFTGSSFRRIGLDQAIRNLAATIPNVNIVSKSNPIMDDRYCLNKRLAKDPPASVLPELKVESMLLEED